jgi:hypothetical protein
VDPVFHTTGRAFGSLVALPRLNSFHAAGIVASELAIGPGFAQAFGR